MTIFALIGMIATGLLIASVGGYTYHKQKAKQEIEGSGVGNRAGSVGAAYLLSFGGILVVLGITFLLEVLKQ